MMVMASETPHGTIRRLLPYTSVALLIVALYVAWVFFSRWQSNHDVEQARREKAAESSRKTLEQLGGSDLKILSFSATPGAVRAGDRVVLCYGVNNAKDVRMDPAVDGVGPALSRCVEAHPRRTTEYTLTATDAAGHTASEKLTVNVQ
jgi:hypothetical protein